MNYLIASDNTVTCDRVKTSHPPALLVVCQAVVSLVQMTLGCPRLAAAALQARWREIAAGELEVERLLRTAAVSSPASRSSFAPNDALADFVPPDQAAAAGQGRPRRGPSRSVPAKSNPIAAILSALFALALCGSAQGAVYTFSGPFANNGAGAGVIPDNSLIGLADAHSLSGLGSSISDVVLTVHLSGSAIDDLTGYLRLGNLVGSPSVDLASYLTPGNNDFTVNLTDFNSLNPNSTWTLFFADTSSGGENTLASWSLNITAVPEPANVALGIFAGVLVLAGLARAVITRRAGNRESFLPGQ